MSSRLVARPRGHFRPDIHGRAAMIEPKVFRVLSKSRAAAKHASERGSGHVYPGGDTLSTRPVLLLGSAPSPCRLRRQQLQRAGFAVRWVLKTFDSLQMIQELCPVLVLINAPNARRPGREVCRKIRDAFSAVGVRLMVFGPKIPAADLVAWLECGVDDYIDDAVDAAEFLTRVKAVLRGLGPLSPGWNSPIISSRSMKIGGIELDVSGMRLLVRGREVPITNLEFRFLQFLIQHHAEIFTRNELLGIVWKGDNSRTLRAVDSCVKRIREKIVLGDQQSIRISTVRGVGYRLDILSEWTT
jgi:DNA-binding response OmpR family regulator